MKILVAEDDIVLQRLLKSNLEKWGHEVTSAEDGEKAWEVYQREEFPLVITDWMMPHMDGLELIRHIRAGERPYYTYTIMLTAKSQKEDIVTGMEAGADDFVTKPFDRDELRVRLRAGERIVSLERKLIQSEKLASLGQMAAGIAQEIQEPVTYLSNNMTTLRRDVLSAIQTLNAYHESFARLSQNDLGLAEERERIEGEMNIPYVKEHLPRQFTTSLDELYHLRDIANKLQDFAQSDDIETKEVSLPALLESVIEIAQYQIKKNGLNLETEFAELPKVRCNPGKISQVFLNLIVNAVQASAAGDTIRVTARRESPVGTGEESVIVEIEDTGAGIAAEHLPRLFDPFFSTKAGSRGSGMGLSVSYGILRDHHGSIDVESREGEGSRFRVKLPVTAGEEEPAPRAVVYRDPLEE